MTRREFAQRCRPAGVARSRQPGSTAARLLLLVVLVGSIAAADRALLPTISHDDLVSALAHHTAVLIEVKAAEAGEPDNKKKKPQAHAHLPHAVTYADVVDGRAKLPKDRQALVVVYSDEAGHSRLPAVIADLRQRGYGNLRRYSGGARGWLEHGGTLENADQPTTGSGADGAAGARDQ
jgi:hypothetical protein